MFKWITKLISDLIGPVNLKKPREANQPQYVLVSTSVQCDSIVFRVCCCCIMKTNSISAFCNIWPFSSLYARPGFLLLFPYQVKWNTIFCTVLLVGSMHVALLDEVSYHMLELKSPQGGKFQARVSFKIMFPYCTV